MVDKSLLIAAAETVGVSLSPEAAEKFDTYAARLVEWNEKINLTALTAPRDIVWKHFADSLSAAPYLPKTPFSLIDVGTGAGFPGVPLALVRPDLQLTLLDSLQKRLTFLDALCKELGIPVTLVHARAEDGGHDPALREQFDVATARAVANLPVLCEYCLPFVKVGGQFLGMKGPSGDDELAAASAAVKKLGGKPARIRPLTLDTAGEPFDRTLIFIDKIGKTPSAYPRPAAKIKKTAL